MKFIKSADLFGFSIVYFEPHYGIRKRKYLLSIFASIFFTRHHRRLFKLPLHRDIDREWEREVDVEISKHLYEPPSVGHLWLLIWWSNDANFPFCVFLMIVSTYDFDNAIEKCSANRCLSTYLSCLLFKVSHFNFNFNFPPLFLQS